VFGSVLSHLLQEGEGRLGTHLALILFLAGAADRSRERRHGDLAITILKPFPLHGCGLLETRSLDVHNPVLKPQYQAALA
jgi:hypothetical protein